MSNDARAGRSNATRIFCVVALSACLAGNGFTSAESNEIVPTTSQEANQSHISAYDRAVLNDHPVLFLNLGHPAQNAVEIDETGAGHNGRYFPHGSIPLPVSMPNGDAGLRFDGDKQYLEVATDPSLSVPTTGILSIETWIAAGAVQFKNQEGSGYVYWIGKGDKGEYEYAGRMYSFTNEETPPRPNRISGYAFNLSGGLGSGSYFQDPVSLHEWIHVVFVINTRAVSPEFPTGYFAIYKNGRARKTTPLNQFNVVPAIGNAPFRVGTMNLRSYFAGAIGKVALYNYELTDRQIMAHTELMLGRK